MQPPPPPRCLAPPAADHVYISATENWAGNSAINSLAVNSAVINGTGAISLASGKLLTNGVVSIAPAINFDSVKGEIINMGNLTLAGGVNGSNGLTVLGNGSLELAHEGNVTGAVSFNGQRALSANNALQGADLSAAVDIGATTQNLNSFSGSVVGSGAIVAVNNISLSQSVVSASLEGKNVSLNLNGGAFGGNIQASQTVSLYETTVSGVISGTANVHANGATFTNLNSYTGATTGNLVSYGLSKNTKDQISRTNQLSKYGGIHMKSEMIIRSILLLALSVGFPGLANADTYTFNFTGRMTIGIGPGGSNVITGGAQEFDFYQTPISASLTYDTVTGLGDSPLSITLDNAFLGASATFHDISITRIGTTNLFNGALLADWNGSFNIPFQTQWDATGFLNAVNSGELAVGDKISGDVLYRDVNNDHTYSQVVIASLGSATSYADLLVANAMANNGDVPINYTPQYYAPLAASSASVGVTSGGLQGVKVYLDIDSGNSLYVTSITAVPEPEAYAMMLAGLGLVGMIARRRKS